MEEEGVGEVGKGNVRKEVIVGVGVIKGRG